MLISEVSAKFGLSQDTLRYYERVGLIPRVPRRDNGIRDYDQTSCGWIEFVHCMRMAGMPIESLIEYVQLYQLGSSTKEARLVLLTDELARMDERLAELQATRQRLAWKIEHYDNINKKVGDSLQDAKKSDK